MRHRSPLSGPKYEPYKLCPLTSDSQIPWPITFLYSLYLHLKYCIFAFPPFSLLLESKFHNRKVFANLVHYCYLQHQNNIWHKIGSHIFVKGRKRGSKKANTQQNWKGKQATRNREVPAMCWEHMWPRWHLISCLGPVKAYALYPTQVASKLETGWSSDTPQSASCNHHLGAVWPTSYLITLSYHFLIYRI